MRRLIDDLLMFSRVTTKPQVLVRIELGQVLECVLGDLEVGIEKAGASVEAGPLPAIEADPMQMRQLFQNLIGNALKFRADRPPRVRVAAARAGDRWVISVADNGIGIEPQYLERIFGLGERLHTVARYPGNGIGLATCEKIVQRHGGRIWAESPGLDQGATISVALPACPDPPGPANA